MSHKKLPAPAVVSTGCSGIMSCLSLHRRGPAPQPRSNDEAPLRESTSHADGGGDAAAEQYWKRVQFLEEEIRRLGKWLGQEERLGSGAECARSNAKARYQESSSSTAATKRCVNVGHSEGGVQEMVKLEDGSYLHEIRRVGRPWERLAMQVSQPVVPENAASASEVIDKMTMTKAEDVCKILLKMMPMKDIAGRQKPGETVLRTARLNSGDDFLEAVLFKAMDKMEGLVLEGLKIQMASTTTDFTTTAPVAAADRKREETTVSKDCMVHVILIQVRDPKEGYGAIGDPMIGLMEVSLERKDGKVKLEMQELHIAGIIFSNRTRGDSRGMMWSASLRQCKGLHNGGGGGGGGCDGCRYSYVRNPNRVFQQ